MLLTPTEFRPSRSGRIQERPKLPEPGWPARFRNRVATLLGPADREVLWLYLLTRLSLWGTAYCTRWLFPTRPGTHDPGPVLTAFERWDWHHYLHIAQDGYFPGGTGSGQDGGDNRAAFFPGFPMLLRAVHTVIPNWTAAGLLISFVAGAVAVLALARLAKRYTAEADAGQRAVLFFLLSPCAVFLAAGYTEALFLALALPAWLAALRRNWPLAAALTALATTVRVSGLFLAAAVALHFLLTVRSRDAWRALPWLALPAVPAGLYAWYLQAHTGDWMAWKHAQERGWYRTLHTPWDTWSVTWDAAFGQRFTTGYGFMFQAELVAMVAGLVLIGGLLWRRHWPEAVYICLTLAALGTSYWYTSIPRSTLLWWPLWIFLAAWSLRRPQIKTVYLCLVGPLTTIFAITFLSGRWTG
ncbi:mannosyltransferase family protein [Streptomyces sp. NBC_01429]|uniref:mannosyltransferase family protein n=1 Tax=Streptomyces sp. NBC_01429 TaxID=2903862 RepID=UPI002E28ABA7|nr:mannosyltransferase family protein [Streptomyces sp. NBC_01429]